MRQIYANDTKQHRAMPRVASRFASAPEGSYTKRLFNDASLLQSKITEEADELCRAETPDDVAFEAADLLYFALTKCIASGVGHRDLLHGRYPSRPISNVG